MIAAGRVEVEVREQAVEHLDGGTVGEVLVRDGARVAAGDVLIRLGDSDVRSEAAMLEAEAAELAARRNRLEAEFRDADAIAWGEELAVRAGSDPAVRTILDGQERLFAARRASRAGQTAQLRERIGQTHKQIAGLQAQVDALERQTGFIARELEAQRSLFEKGLTELHRLMALEREAARLDGQAGDIAARIAAARGRIAELEILILQIGTTRVEEAEAGAREGDRAGGRERPGCVGVRGRRDGGRLAAGGGRRLAHRQGRRRRCGGDARRRGRPCARPGAGAGHAGRGESAHRGPFAAQLSRQAVDRLFLTLAARGVSGVQHSVPAMTRYRA